MKDFTQWHDLKTTLNARQDAPTFQQQEIWWCSFGANVGHETDGKSTLFSRPILIIRKFNAHIFWGTPLTTQIKLNPYYYRITYKHKEQCVMLSQLRLWESKRLLEKMGKISDSVFEEVREALKSLL